MEKHYKHMTMEEREMMAQLHWEGTGVNEIAQILGRGKGTISRELERNTSPKYQCYTPCQAQRRADARRAEASGRRSRLKDGGIRQYVEEKLSVGWSPELIGGRLKTEHPGKTISYEAIYQYIYHPTTETREELIACLRRAHRKRKPKGIGRKEKKTKIPNRVSIEERPLSVENRRVYGHWEGDSPVSRMGAGHQ
jgi:IS30 family transposase